MTPKTDGGTRPLFRDPTGQKRMFEKSYQEELEEQAEKPVECLGQTFANDQERRAYFTERLREHLQDPAFRQIEGFPIGEDEDILALSDPPYYTACPNPFLPDIIAHWREEREALRRELGLPEPLDRGVHREARAAVRSRGEV